MGIPRYSWVKSKNTSWSHFYSNSRQNYQSIKIRDQPLRATNRIILICAYNGFYSNREFKLIVKVKNPTCLVSIILLFYSLILFSRRSQALPDTRFLCNFFQRAVMTVYILIDQFSFSAFVLGAKKQTDFKRPKTKSNEQLNFFSNIFFTLLV